MVMSGAVRIEAPLALIGAAGTMAVALGVSGIGCINESV